MQRTRNFWGWFVITDKEDAEANSSGHEQQCDERHTAFAERDLVDAWFSLTAPA
jgi:hypothetical protein